MRLFTALGCSAQPCIARLTLKPMAHHLKSGGALRAQAAQNRAVRTVIIHTGLCCAPDDLRGSIARAALHLTLHSHMAWRHTATPTCLCLRSGM